MVFPNKTKTNVSADRTLLTGPAPQNSAHGLASLHHCRGGGLFKATLVLSAQMLGEATGTQLAAPCDRNLAPWSSEGPGVSGGLHRPTHSSPCENLEHSGL